MTFQITVYSKSACPQCDSAKKLLQSRSLPFEEIKIDDEAERLAFYAKCGPSVRQMPQIFINNPRVGGLAGLQAALRRSASDTRFRPSPGYWYFAAVMNSLKVSHHTITVLNLAGSTPCGSGTMKLLNVFTSPTRDIWGLRRLKSASVSTNSGDR